MIQQQLVMTLLEASHMERWTDRIRPYRFTAMGKFAHMMTAVWILGKHQTDQGNPVDWRILVESGLFELLQVCVVSDIKGPVLEDLMKRPKAKADIRNHVNTQLKSLLSDVDSELWERFRAYEPRPNSTTTESEIIRAASWLATDWEFKRIEALDSAVHGTERPKKKLAADRKPLKDLVDVLEGARANKDLANLFDLCGRMRFQDRWTQTPIVPRRPVLDHSLLVAVLAYLSSLDQNVDLHDPGRAARNFFAGLFHDLGEATTRDIIQPVKYISDEVGRAIEAIEERYYDENVEPLVPGTWQGELRDYVLRPFKAGGLHDGPMVKACDNFAAFMEAYVSVKCGTYSPWLKSAILSIFEHRRQYSDTANASARGADFEVVYELCFFEIEPQLRTIG